MRKECSLITFICLNALIISNVFARPTSLKLEKPNPIDQEGLWYFWDLEDDKVPGVSLSKINQYGLNFDSEPIIIAVIDTGIDINHEVLRPYIWVNKNEIPGNHIDDDQNGYIDDIVGWNFLGESGVSTRIETYEDQVIFADSLSKDKHIATDSYAITRKLQYLENQTQLTKKKQEELEYLKTYIYQKHIMAKSNLSAINREIQTYQAALSIFGFITDENLTTKNINKLKTTNQIEKESKDLLLQYQSEQRNLQSLKEYQNQFSKEFHFFYNKNLNQREKVVRDSPLLLIEKGYGNNDVIGPLALHGTSVAGIIALMAQEIQIPIKIMPLKAISEGDERDKDIINAIYYAVDNGAKIINMSFGKDDSLYPLEVFKALKYAQEHNVLVIHAAGNEFKNLDRHKYYPLKKYQNEMLTNMMTVGSHNQIIDVNFFSSFSNFGRKSVDLIAPGNLITSLTLNKGYGLYSGTSLSAPILSTVAAFTLLLDPQLTPKEQVALIKNSLNDFSSLKVFKAGAGRTKLKKLVDKAGSPNLEFILQNILRSSSK